MYVVGGAVVLGVLTMCCLSAAAGVALIGARDDAQVELTEARRSEQTAVDTAEAQRPTGQTPVQPPPSLNLSPTPTSDRRSRHIEATVTRVEGGVASVGDRCSFDVRVLERTGPPGHYCRVFAECAGVRLFGEETPRRTGFFPCELYDAPFGVAGEDLEPTIDVRYGDPIFQIDTRAGTFMAADNQRGHLGVRYYVVARVDSVTAPPDAAP